MPFSATASIISTDLDNMLRGLYRDNSDTVLANTTNEVTLKSVSIAANTIAPTGGIHFIMAGTLAGTNSTKTMRLKFGGTTIATITQGAGTTTAWHFDVWMFNSATNSQRLIIRTNVNDLLTLQETYSTLAIDTTANQTLAVTGQLGNIADTITQTMMDVFVVQIN